jgi:hypothetical protein
VCFEHGEQRVELEVPINAVGQVVYSLHERVVQSYRQEHCWREIDGKIGHQKGKELDKVELEVKADGLFWRDCYMRDRGVSANKRTTEF